LGTTEQKELLVVDDEDDFLDLVDEIFGASGYRVLTAHSAAEAEEYLQGSPCDVAIVDYRLPGKNGAHVAQRIRERWPSTRIVFLTGDSEAARRIERQGLDVAACLVKPVEVDSLLELVEELRRSARDS